MESMLKLKNAKEWSEWSIYSVSEEVRVSLRDYKDKSDKSALPAHAGAAACRGPGPRGCSRTY